MLTKLRFIIAEAKNRAQVYKRIYFSYDKNSISKFTSMKQIYISTACFAIFVFVYTMQILK